MLRKKNDVDNILKEFKKIITLIKEESLPEYISKYSGEALKSIMENKVMERYIILETLQGKKYSIEAGKLFSIVHTELIKLKVLLRNIGILNTVVIFRDENDSPIFLVTKTSLN